MRYVKPAYEDRDHFNCERVMEFLKRLKKAFDERGIEIPFPQQVVHTPSASRPTSK